MNPTLLIASSIFIIAPPVDVDGTRWSIFGPLLYENNIIYDVIIPTFVVIYLHFYLIGEVASIDEWLY